jgi:hypothetical protein
MPNGLTSKEEKMLCDYLRKLDALYGKRAYLGGGDAEAIRLLATKIRVRLKPHDAADLVKEAEQIFEPCKEFVWFQPAMDDAA